MRVEVDSSGCLRAEWDSLRWQEQWVVELRADGPASVIDVGHLPAGVYTVTAATPTGPASARLTVAK